MRWLWIRSLIVHRWLFLFVTDGFLLYNCSGDFTNEVVHLWTWYSMHFLRYWSRGIHPLPPPHPCNWTPIPTPGHPQTSSPTPTIDQSFKYVFLDNANADITKCTVFSNSFVSIPCKLLGLWIPGSRVSMGSLESGEVFRLDPGRC